MNQEIMEFDASPLRREQKLERVSKYIKKNIKLLEEKKFLSEDDYTTIRNLINTKKNLTKKLIFHSERFYKTPYLKDKYLITTLVS